MVFTRSEGRRLQKAHDNGYLDAKCHDNRAIVKAYGLWCWRLKLPMIWFVRSSRYSRFSTLRLDMLTTPNMLTPAGQESLAALAEGKITAHDAVWARVPRVRVEKIAHGVLRAALQVGNYRLNRTPVAKIDTRGKLKVALRKRA